MDLISKRTRREFQEWLSGCTLKEITILFDNYNVQRAEIPEGYIPSGQRRSLVEEYYSGTNWANPRDVRKVLSVYEDILLNIKQQLDQTSIDDFVRAPMLKSTHAKLVSTLKRDDLSFDGETITLPVISTVDFAHDATDLLDPNQFDEYIGRIRSSIDEDPALAIGSTKELIESVLKTVLTNSDGADFDKDDDVPKLLKKAQKALKLVPDDVDSAAKGADIIKVLLNNLGSIAIKLAELRNIYGTGHGTDKKRKGLEPRHAKLAVSAGIALSSFLLDTFKNRSAK